AESDALRARWEGRADGRIGYAYAPRFVLSCSEELLREVGGRVHRGARLHTHASEQQAEIEVVRRERGLDNIVYLESVGLARPRAGATAMPALTALELATRGGAAALGLEGEIGSLEPGKRADVIVVDPRGAHATPRFDPVSTLVYACQSRDVRDVIVDGRVLV